MPVYEYKCPKCNYELEKEHKIKEEPIVLCPECHEWSNGMNCTIMVKQISLSSFSLKGTGWYRDGYKGK